MSFLRECCPRPYTRHRQTTHVPELAAGVVVGDTQIEKMKVGFVDLYNKIPKKDIETVIMFHIKGR